ncbi:MAG TPA: peroxiredoxin-like family protein [Solirubrobacteraceae bacterium]|nr:peroxiredoxin-like family protein [Solirubrobacteraceae bacterium]
MTDELSSYAEQRDELAAAMAGRGPEEVRAGFAAAAARLAATDFAQRAPKVGEQAPRFTLPDQSGEDVALAELLAEGPVVLIFYRGAWCPFCNLYLRAFQARLGRVAQLGATLVAISPQAPDGSLAMAEKNALGFSVLSDGAASAIDAYGLRWEVDEQLQPLFKTVGNDLAEINGEVAWALPATATFVIDAAGVVRYVKITGNWRERAEPDEVLEVLAGLGG